MLQVIAGIGSLMSARTIQTQHLVAEGAPPELSHNAYVRIGSLVAVFAVSIPLAFVIGQYTYIWWSLSPVLMRLWFFVAARRRQAPKSVAPGSQASA